MLLMSGSGHKRSQFIIVRSEFYELFSVKGQNNVRKMYLELGFHDLFNDLRNFQVVMYSKHTSSSFSTLSLYVSDPKLVCLPSK